MKTLTSSKSNNAMGTRPVFPLLLSMSLPVMLSMLIQSLYNIVDSYWVAKLGTDALTAVSLAFPLQNIIMSAGVGMGIGIASKISIFLGSGDHEGAGRAASMGTMLVMLHCVIFFLGGIFITKPFLSLFTRNQAVLSSAFDYTYIVLCLSFGQLIQMCLEKIFQGAGKMLTTMFLMGTGAVINMLLDPVMIFGLFGFPAMGIRGAALATVAGQICGLLLYIIVYKFTDLGFSINLKHAKFDKILAEEIYSVAIPSSLMLSLPSLLTGILNGILVAFGDIYVAILGLYFKLQTFINMPANGIIQGMRPIIGYNYGSKDYKRVKSTIMYALLLVSLISFAGTFISVVFPGPVLNLFDAEPALLKEGIRALRIIGPSFLISAAAVVVCGVLEALGQGKTSLIISLIRQFILLVPVGWLLSFKLGPVGIWVSFPVAEIAGLIAAYKFLKKLFSLID